MDLLLFLAADYATKEASGKLNIQGVFNVIYTKQFPAIHKHFYLVIRFAAAVGEFETEHDIKIIFVDDDGKELVAQTGTFQLPKPEKGKRSQLDLIIEVNDLFLPTAGQYEFRLIINRDLKGVIPLDIAHSPENVGQ